MKFGKTLQAQIYAQNGFPGWSSYFCDYKGLKKIINSLAKGRPADAALLAAGVRPPRPPPEEQQPVEATTTEAQQFAHASTANGGVVGDGPATLLQAHKAAFFFKLERELEKINDFYHQRESALKVRLRTLIDKRKILIAQLQDPNSKVRALNRDSSSFGALHEGFKTFERDLSRLQTYIELNATAFRKICKKWDKACRRQADRFGESRPQEGQPDGQLYLARQVEVQPVFNREFIAQLSDVASANLVSLENVVGGDARSRAASSVLADGVSIDGATRSAPHLPTLFDRADRTEALEDLEAALVSAVRAGDKTVVAEVLELLAPSEPTPTSSEEPKSPVTRILWRATLEEPEKEAGDHGEKQDRAIPEQLLDFSFVDDINGRTALHEAASAGRMSLVISCLDKSLSVSQADVYGRQPLHYAAMNGHPAICRTLLAASASPSVLDLDGYSPIIYSITHGRTEVVQTFLSAGVSFDGTADPSTSDLNALSLACQYGHEDIARLLLERGAKVVADPAGYWPQHLAAKEGRSGVLRLLVEATGSASALDVPDKFAQATPLVHAASEGHVECVEVLLAAGSDVHAVDEFKRSAVHYAAWHGHVDCVNLLVAAGATRVAPAMDAQAKWLAASNPTMDLDALDAELDGDLIPSLSLPPPIIPFHVYGHAYLSDQKHLIQITLGHPNTSRAPFPPPVRLHEQPSQSHPASLKLVITPKPDSSGSCMPHSVILPLTDEREVFSFQVDSLTDSVEFDLYPSFGSNHIGKAVASSSTFTALKAQGSYAIPIVDPHLKVCGDLFFELSYIKPFGRTQLQIGRRFETYWKSLSGEGGPTSVVTASSLSGEHVRIVVQVTSDGHPVAWPLWALPVDGLDVRVADVTLEQFKALARKLGKTVSSPSMNDEEDAAAWYRAISDALVPLDELLSLLPSSLGVNLELRYPTSSDVARLNLARTLEVNDFVDSVLSAVYRSIQPSSSSSTSSASFDSPHRRIVFSSFNPIVCTALNWKQPNFSVFFASFCGLSRTGNASNAETGRLVSANRVEEDRRCTSIREAVKFAKANHLLGIMLDATMLAQIPSLLEAAKEHGLLVATFGSAADRVPLADAHMATDGVLSYATNDFLQQTAAS